MFGALTSAASHVNQRSNKIQRMLLKIFENEKVIKYTIILYLRLVKHTVSYPNRH